MGNLMSNRRANLRPRKSVVALTGAAALMALLTACNGTANSAATVSSNANGTAKGASSVSGTATTGRTSDSGSSSDNTPDGGTATKPQAAPTGATSTTGSNGGATSNPATADNGAPSACRPANHTAKITPGPGSAGHFHYEVTLTAAPGYATCQLAGSPTDAKFSDHGSLKGVTAGTYGDQGTVVNFGPGHPVHFDIQVPDDTTGTPADEVTFTLRTPDGGVIPGESFADGTLTVDAGTVIGPVQPGA
jgi:hypothetical protein